LSKSLQKRIDELNQQLASLKEKTAKLKLEAKKWIEKRNSLNTKIKRLREEATNLKERRDALNEKVKELKELREHATSERKEKKAQILELKKKLKVLLRTKPSRSMQNIQKEIEGLEWKIQTTPFSVKEEKPLIDQVKVLESQLSVHRQIQQLEENIVEMQTKEKALATRAQLLHEKLSELAQQSQKLHEEMLESLNKSRSIKLDADDAHQKFLQIKKRAQNPHEKCMELLHQIRSLQLKLRQKEEKKKAQRQVELREEMETKALKKFKQGEKLTWEEFKLLAERGKL
jgi:uncharacterized coiled-coil DUF342 family protein